MVTSLVMLGDAVSKMKGRRTFNNIKALSALAQLLAIAYGLTEIMDNTWGEEYTPLFLVMFILIYFMMQYFFGTDYSVKVEKSQHLLEAVTEAIAAVEFSKAEKKQEKDITKFIFPDSKKRIEIKVRDSYVSSTEKVHTIHFKRWFSAQTKREIMRSVEAYLYLHDDFKYKKRSIIFQFIGASVATVVCIFLLSAAVMEPERIEVISNDRMPAEIHELTTDTRYTDKVVIERLYEILNSTGTYRWKGVTAEEVKEVTELEVNYGYPWRTLYVGERNNMVLFIDHSERAEQSDLHWIASKIYGIYNKAGGTYYRVYGEDGIYEMLKQ
ncbi:hypothetical protein [Alkaliphilus metalliredigens]|nr:hypothetical protein [Alkaliphilus metalliredigens]